MRSTNNPRVRFWVGNFLVMAQFGLLLMLAVLAKSPEMVLSWLLHVTGVGLGGWSVWSMRSSRLVVVPRVVSGAVLITTGPYRWIRHPMYLAVLLVGLGLGFEGAVVNWFVFIALAVVLGLKIWLEEQDLNRKLKGYGQYARDTARLIPGIW